LFNLPSAATHVLAKYVVFVASRRGECCIAKNAEFADTMSQMVAVKSTITNMVPNFCTGNPGAIAAWDSAAHVESSPKKKVPPTPPTP
jgi:hypothetical protein